MTTMRAALTDPTGLVVNVVLASEDYETPAGLSLVELADDSPVGPGWTLTGGAATEPPATLQPEPAPTQLELLQAQVDELTDLILMGGL